MVFGATSVAFVKGRRILQPVWEEGCNQWQRSRGAMRLQAAKGNFLGQIMSEAGG